MEIFWTELRYGLRMLGKNRGLTFVIVLTLGLGIGANTAIFSVVNSFLLRPLPVKDANRLMVLAISHPGNQNLHGISYLDLQDFRQGTNAFSDICGFAVGFVGLSDKGRAERITVSYVTGNYFTTLGIQPALGRTILPSEGRTPGADGVIVLGYRYWERRFGGDPTVLGRAVRVNGHLFTVVGVLPSKFNGTYSMIEMDSYMPISMASFESGNDGVLTNRNNHRLNVLGSLKPDVSIRQATASLQIIAKHLGEQYPDTDKDLKVYVLPEPTARPSPENARTNPPVAGIFLGLVAVVLLVACVNVVNILLAQAATRQKDLAICVALGASPMRLIRQLLIESVMLSVLGAAAGLLIGGGASQLLGSIRLPGDLPIQFDFSLDWRVFTYVAAITLSTGILIGLLPALRALRMNVNDMLHGSSHTISGGTGGHRMRATLVVAQVAGSVILVIAAALFVRSLGNAQTVNLGFEPDHVLNLVMDPGQLGYDQARTKTFYREVEGRARAVLGVRSASVSFSIPMGYYSANTSVVVEGQVLKPNEKGLGVGYNMIGTDYFKTMGIRLIEGQEFTSADSETSPPVAIINKLLAAQLWPGQEPIGKRFSYKGTQGPYVQVVGVTENGKYGSIFEDQSPFFYVPISQEYSSMRVLQVRTNVPPQQLARPLEIVIQSLEPELPVNDVITLEESLQGENGFFPLRIGTAITGALGLLGLVLAIIGVYGVVSYASIQRTQEVGLRMALGAQRRDILKVLVGHGLVLVFWGLGIGLVLMFALSRLLANLLFGIKPYDPVTYTSVVLLFSAVALVACYLPARRSTRVDPMVALRYE